MPTINSLNYQCIVTLYFVTEVLKNVSLAASSSWKKKKTEGPVDCLYETNKEFYLTRKTVKCQVLLHWNIRNTHECLKCTPKDTELNWVEIPPTWTNLLSLRLWSYLFHAVRSFLLCSLLFFLLHLKDWLERVCMTTCRTVEIKQALSSVDFTFPKAPYMYRY